MTIKKHPHFYLCSLYEIGMEKKILKEIWTSPTFVLHSTSDYIHVVQPIESNDQTKILLSGADPGFGVMGDEIRQGDLRVLLIIIVSDVYGTYDAGKLK